MQGGAQSPEAGPGHAGPLPLGRQVEERVVGGAPAHVEAQDPADQVGGGVGSLVGGDQVGGEHDVEALLPQGPALGAQGVRGALPVVDHGHCAGQDTPDLVHLRGGEQRRVDDQGAARARQREPVHAARNGARVPLHQDGDRGVVPRPLGDVGVLLARPHGDVRPPVAARRRVGPTCLLRSGAAHVGDLADPPAQRTELERVEEGLDLREVGGPPAQVVDAHSQVEVVDEAVEPAVAADLVGVVAQGLPALAADLVRARQQVVQPVEAGDPLRGGIRPDPRHSRQVVAGLAHQGRDLRVAVRGDAVLRLDRSRIHAPQVPRSGARVEHRDALAHGLEGIAVARHHQDAHARLGAPARHGGQDVVRLVVLLREARDAHGAEHLLDEFDLALELLRRRVARALVLRVLVGAEGMAGQVEGDGNVGGPLLLQQAREHRHETVDGVRAAPRRRHEFVRGQGVERAVRHRMAVDDHHSVTHT